MSKVTKQNYVWRKSCWERSTIQCRLVPRAISLHSCTGKIPWETKKEVTKKVKKFNHNRGTHERTKSMRGCIIADSPLLVIHE